MINIEQIKVDWINVDQCKVDRVDLTAHPQLMDRTLLTSDEAAGRLGIKRDTLYAYVSRGLLSRQVSLDGRSSLFDAEEIDAFRSRRHRTSDGELSTVIVSSITQIAEQGLRYGDLDVEKLVRDDIDFEVVADGFWASIGSWELPDELLERVITIQQGLGDAALIDRLRVTIAVLSAADSLRHDLSPAAFGIAGRRMLVGMIDGLPLRGDPTAAPRSGRLADRLWSRMTAEAGTPDQRRCLNAALVLLADHGLAPSTFGVRIAASVRADPYSVVSTGLGVFRGALHGAASPMVHRMLERAVSIGPESALGEKLAQHELVPGFGHVIYRSRDPREAALTELIEQAWVGDERLATALALRELVSSRVGAAPNVDFALGLFALLSNMGPEGGEVFAIGRTVGWLAHAIEEMKEPPLRFRPVARYVRPEEPPPPGI